MGPLVLIPFYDPKVRKSRRDGQPSHARYKSLSTVYVFFIQSSALIISIELKVVTMLKAKLKLSLTKESIVQFTFFFFFFVGRGKHLWRNPNSSFKITWWWFRKQSIKMVYLEQCQKGDLLGEGGKFVFNNRLCLWGLMLYDKSLLSPSRIIGLESSHVNRFSFLFH